MGLRFLARSAGAVLLGVALGIVRRGDVAADVLHDAMMDIWERAGTFDPERFMGVDDAEAICTFIPQGGAEVRTGHRCPGEKIAVTSLSAAVVALARPNVELGTDPDDLTFSWTHMLTRPVTGVRVRSTR